MIKLKNDEILILLKLITKKFLEELKEQKVLFLYF